MVKLFSLGLINELQLALRHIVLREDVVILDNGRLDRWRKMA